MLDGRPSYVIGKFAPRWRRNPLISERWEPRCPRRSPTQPTHSILEKGESGPLRYLSSTSPGVSRKLSRNILTLMAAGSTRAISLVLKIPAGRPAQEILHNVLLAFAIADFNSCWRPTPD